MDYAACMMKDEDKRVGPMIGKNMEKEIGKR